MPRPLRLFPWFVSPPRREAMRVMLLLGVVTVAWLGLTNRLTPESWLTPAAYNVDALETLARFQLAAEQGALFNTAPVVDRLGAPWGADWSAYPLPDAPWYALAGVLANRLGLVPASNVMLLLTHLAAALAFYLCARALRHRALIAAGAALLYAFAYTVFFRGLSHHSFALVFSVPPALLVTWWVGAGRGIWQRRGPWWVAGGTAVLLGTASPYFLLMFLQWVGLAWLYRWTQGRERRALVAGGLVIALALLTFLAVNWPAVRGAVTPESAATLQRNYAGTELYGLKPIELILPPASHRWAAAAAGGARYAGGTSLPGELFAPYLGVVGMLALAGMVVVYGRRLLRGRAGLRPSHLPLTLWVGFFAMVGGLNGLLALAGLDHFRAGGRYSIHVLALALFFVSGWASRHTRGWSTRGVALVALPLLGLGLWDQSPRAPTTSQQAGLRAQWQSDETAGRDLAVSLPPGSMVFQLPVVPFPEAGSRHGMSDYEHLRLLWGAPGLHFSHGHLRGTLPYFWNDYVASLPPAAMIEELERHGFAALVIDQRGYPHQAQDLRRELHALGYTVSALTGRPELSLVRLRPVATPAFPDLSRIEIHPRWAPTEDGPASLHAVAGWFGLEQAHDHQWRWAGAEAVLGVRPTQADVHSLGLRATAASLTPGTLRLYYSGEYIAAWELGPTPREIRTPPLPGTGASIRLEWRFDGKLARGEGDPRHLGFQLSHLRVIASP